MTEADAHRIFAEEQAAFARVYPSALSVRFCIRKRHFLPKPAERDYAWFEPATRWICLTRRGLALSEGHVRGILRHELGHAVDAQIDAPGAERRADRIAEVAGGVRYLRDLQHARRGVKLRPAHLHQ